MTPPCANCHGASRTPDLPDPLPEPSACPAEPRWPAWLRVAADPELRAQDWWVRSNFESAREPRSPLRIELGEARLEAELRLRPQARSFVPFPWRGSPYHAVGVEISSGARLHSSLEVRDSALQLGLRNLVEVNGVFLDGPAPFNFWPERVSVGDYGEVHLISRATASALFVFDPFMVPRPALGHDIPTDGQWQEVQDCLTRPRDMDGGSCYPAMTYPNHRSNPRIDQLLTDFVPRELLDPDGRLPREYPLETLLARLLEWRHHRPTSSSAPDPRGPWTRIRAALEPLSQWLEAGSSLTLSVAQLNDLFLPGILDLGPSNGSFEATYRGGQRIALASRDLEINLDPIDWPATPRGERPGLRLETGNLRASGAAAELEGVRIEPGLRVAFDAASGMLRVEGNLNLATDLTLPGLGAIELSGQLLFSSQWRLDDAGLHPVPAGTALEFRDGELWRADGTPLFTRFTLSLNDLPVSALDDLLEIPPEGGSEPSARLRISGWVGRERFVEARATVPLPLGFDGGYDFEALLESLTAQVAVQILGERSYALDLGLEIDATRAAPGLPARARHFGVTVEAREGSGDGAPLRPLVRGGRLDVDLVHVADGQDQYVTRIAAAGIDHGPIALREVSGELRVERFHHDEGVTRLLIPELRLVANPHGAERGLLRGRQSLELSGRDGEPLFVEWNARARHLEVRGLELSFSLQNLRVLPPRARRMFDPRTAGVGLDGAFEGSFGMDFPEDRRRWRGAGELRLRGDRDGDVYLVDAAGRRLGYPLVRDTRWRWRRVDRIHWNRRYALGEFHLDTLLNFAALLPDRGAGAASGVAYGLRGQRLNPYEINGVMPYDNQPWDLRGFQNRIVDYLVALCRQDESCRAGMEGDHRP